MGWVGLGWAGLGRTGLCRDFLSGRIFVVFSSIGLELGTNLGWFGPVN